jgi:hypothetical protein
MFGFFIAGVEVYVQSLFGILILPSMIMGVLSSYTYSILTRAVMSRKDRLRTLMTYGIVLPFAAYTWPSPLLFTYADQPLILVGVGVVLLVAVYAMLLLGAQCYARSKPRTQLPSAESFDSGGEF